MPQQPKPFDPNEFVSSPPVFHPDEFAGTASTGASVSASGSVLGPPPAPIQKSPYQPFFDSVAKYIPQPVKTAANVISQPLTDLPSRMAGELTKQHTSVFPGVPTFMNQFVGDTLSEQTSPMNLAMLAASGGESLAGKFGASGLAKLFSLANRVASAPVMASGAHNLLESTDLKSAIPAFVQTVLGGAGTFHSAPKVSASKLPVKNVEASSVELPPIKPDFPSVPISEKLPSKGLPPLPVKENEDIFSYLDRNGVDNIMTTPEEQVVNRAAQTPDVAPTAPVKRVLPKDIPSQYKYLENNTEQDIKDFIARHENNPNYHTEAGQNILNYARDILDERAASPEVPISKELPKQPEATNVTPEDTANLELWYKYKKMYDSGKMTEQQMNQWADLHLKLESRFKYDPPNGTFTISPHRFEGLPPEEPKFTAYVLPDGTEVNLDTSATKGADTTSFTLKDGTIVEAKKVTEAPKVDIHPQPQREVVPIGDKYDEFGNPIGDKYLDAGQDPKVQEANKIIDTAMEKAKFDPSTLGFEGTKPQVDFVDPNTGEIKPAAEAKPGDVPLVPETAPQTQPKLTLVQPANIMQVIESIPKTGNIEFDNLVSRLQILRQAAKNGLNDTEFREFGDIAEQVRNNPNMPPELESRWKQLGEENKARGPKFKVGDQVQVRKSSRGNRRIILTEGPKQTTEQPISPKLQAVFNPEGMNQPWSSVGQVPSTQGNLPIPNTPPLQPAGIPRQYGPNLPPNRPMGPRLPPRPPRNPPPPAPKPGWFRNALNINKAALTAGDFSAPGRQGKAFIFDKAWWTSWDDMFKAFGSKQASDVVHDSIVNHPSGYFKPGTTATGGKIPSFAEKVGLELPEHEEMFTGAHGKRFGGWIDRSSRAHTAFLNKLRSDQFASMIDASKAAGRDPEKDLTIAQAYAKFINDATGRGSLNVAKWKLEKSANVLNDVFFAPKNMSGQIRTWNAVLNPVKYYNYDPVLRKQALKSLFAVAGMGLGVSELSRLGGASVSHDPTNSDFMKIKIGDTRIDPFGGYQQFPVAAAKFITGTSTSSISGKTSDLTSNKFGARNRADVAETFFTNRLSPLGSFVWAWMNNREFDGKPFEVKRAIFERVFPIAAKDVIDLAQTDPALAAGTLVPTMFGLTNTQHYTGR